MIRKMMQGILIAATILTLHAQVLQAEQGEGINPQLWYKLALVDERAYLFTHWQRIHPQLTLYGATTPRVFRRNTHSVDEITYEIDGQSYPLSHYIDKANISGLMVLRDGEVRLEFYGKGLDAQSRTSSSRKCKPAVVMRARRRSSSGFSSFVQHSRPRGDRFLLIS